ncbi:CocE/NonD family hydrolase [Streptomyces decoyicus]|uniref:CocE/NonD family hydrolase n=1 Tax=Streptomyces decoyicus TaxID=249567 RepID=A0ABZ1FMP6_9ACTN|nr:CocE/NonD family hydrolase [Streptomyces decoyicus]WSB71600.1 CocE/NonD family hydrolase [Streptomyces decoyicus]
MLVDWDAPIVMGDGVELRADVFLPDDGETHPVIMSLGPYAKGLAFQEGFAPMWRTLEAEHPDAVAGSSNRYQNWETADPEKWVPDGYVVIRVDSRGAGRSPGYLDILSPRETQDYYDCIEWAAAQPWSNGRVGLLGISYYAVNQWQVAALRPPHLAAICPWEGATDFYRELTHHGGILHVFLPQWYPVQVASMQHGAPDSPRHRVTGVPVTGPGVLSEEERAKNAADTVAALHDHALLDAYYRERSADLARITVPVLSAANWAHHLHTRGGFEGYAGVASEQKWLEVHGLQHWVEFYTDYGVALQKRFFGHFLQGQDTGWDKQPPVFLNVRRADGSFEQRAEEEWPLARTRWTAFHLDLVRGALAPAADPGERSAEFEALGDGLTFWTEPLAEELELTGPASASLRVASSTTDADLFLTLRVQDPDGRDVTFVSAMDPHGAIGLGWLRASLRKLDAARSEPYRPWHTFDERQPLTPGEPVDLEIEIWPTSVVVPAGHRLGVSVLGRDFAFPGAGPWPSAFGVAMRGNGTFVHTDPEDRGSDVYAGRTTLLSGGKHPSFLLLPVVPAGAGKAGSG